MVTQHLPGTTANLLYWWGWARYSPTTQVNRSYTPVRSDIQFSEWRAGPLTEHWQQHHNSGSGDVLGSRETDEVICEVWRVCVVVYWILNWDEIFTDGFRCVCCTGPVQTLKIPGQCLPQIRLVKMGHLCSQSTARAAKSPRRHHHNSSRVVEPIRGFIQHFPELSTVPSWCNRSRHVACESNLVV